MHDLVDYETRGIPSVMVASDEFTRAARTQADALGLPEIATTAVYVPHPIQDATDEEMLAKARNALDALVHALSEPGERALESS